MNNILLVEDEEHLLNKMSNNIDWEENNYRIFTATNGEQALDVVERERIDILITDIKMPRMSGIELIREIRERNLNIIPIIISGYAEFEYARESIRLNVTEYILKPFRSFKLLEVVNKARLKLEEHEKKQQELLRLRNELKGLIAGDFFAGMDLDSMETDVYKKQEIVLRNEDIFMDLKKGSKLELLNDIDSLFTDIKENDIQSQSLYVILNNIILLTFKYLKDMEYDLQQVVTFLKEEGLEQELPGIDESKDWMVNFFLIVNKFITANSKGGDKYLADKVKEAVKKEFSRGITLSELADRFNVSNGYLSRLFYENTGKKFSSYLDDLRIDRARELLKTTDDKIYQIADQVGFDDPYYFSSWFKKRVGIAPTTYRDNLLLFE